MFLLFCHNVEREISYVYTAHRTSVHGPMILPATHARFVVSRGLINFLNKPSFVNQNIICSAKKKIGSYVMLIMKTVLTELQHKYLITNNI